MNRNAAIFQELFKRNVSFEFMGPKNKWQKETFDCKTAIHVNSFSFVKCAALFFSQLTINFQQKFFFLNASMHKKALELNDAVKMK